MKIQRLHRIQIQQGTMTKRSLVTFVPAHVEEETVPAGEPKVAQSADEDVTRYNRSDQSGKRNQDETANQLRHVRSLALQSNLPSRLQQRSIAIFKWLLAHQTPKFQIVMPGGLIKADNVILPQTNLPSIIHSLLLQKSTFQFGEILILRILKSAPLTMIQWIPAVKWKLISGRANPAKKRQKMERIVNTKI